MGATRFYALRRRGNQVMVKGDKKAGPLADEGGLDSISRNRIGKRNAACLIVGKRVVGNAFCRGIKGVDVQHSVNGRFSCH
jgi:hypothetical protein